MVRDRVAPTSSRQAQTIHRILFEIRGDVVVVLRVRHSAQDLLDLEDF
jgi:hypothetical protein